MAKKEKKKREKTVWIDDGRTIADMSGVSGVDNKYTGPKGTFKDQLRTYWNTVKLMFADGIYGFCYILFVIPGATNNIKAVVLEFF